MLNVLFSEIIKLKRSSMLWMILVGALLPTVLNILIQLNVKNNGSVVSWQSMFQNNITFMNVLMGPSLFALFAGYLVAREYQDNAINSLLTYPYSRMAFLTGKLLVIFMIIDVTLALSYIVIFISGTLIFNLNVNFDILKNYLVIFGWMAIMQFALAPISMWVSMLGKTYIPSMILGISAVVSGVVVINSEKYNIIFPYTVPTRIIQSMMQPELGIKIRTGIISLSLTFVIFLITSMIQFSKADAKS